MNRRELIKGVAAAGAIAVLPPFISANNSTHLPFHFIGLGGAGCNALEVIYEKRQEDNFTCITDPVRPQLSDAIQFIPFLSPVIAGTSATDYLLNSNFNLQVTEEMLTLLSHKHHYVLLAGLGGYTGTRLLQAFAHYLLKEERPFTIIASLPFTWETDRRKVVDALVPNLHILPQFHSFDLNQLASKKENKKMNLFFQMANEQFYNLFLHLNPARAKALSV